MEASPASQLFENARRIFDVASAAPDPGDAQDFALLICPDGGLHFVMESPFSIEAAAIHAGARSAYRVTRSRDVVRVEGRSASGDCLIEQDCVIEKGVIEQRRRVRSLLRDQPLYCITSPLLIAGSPS